jgi:hypothetical protein
MGGERSRQGCNVSLHVAGPVISRFAYIVDPDGYVQYVEAGECLGSSEGRPERHKPRASDGYFLRYGYSANSKSPFETRSPGTDMNPSLPPIFSARVDDNCISPPQNQRGVSPKIQLILR